MIIFRNLLCLFFLVTLLSGWKSETADFKEVGNIIGRWSKDAGIIWEIKSDGTYTRTFSGGNSMDGKYTLKDNQITIIDDNSGNAINCPLGQKGIYIFLVELNTLTLTKVNDLCEGRNQMIPGSYNRQE